MELREHVRQLLIWRHNPDLQLRSDARRFIREAIRRMPFKSDVRLRKARAAMRWAA
jgi:hypothetical protein